MRKPDEAVIQETIFLPPASIITSWQIQLGGVRRLSGQQGTLAKAFMFPVTAAAAQLDAQLSVVM